MDKHTQAHEEGYKKQRADLLNAPGLFIVQP
jgi:hypothetical protein